VFVTPKTAPDIEAARASLSPGTIRFDIFVVGLESGDFESIGGGLEKSKSHSKALMGLLPPTD
jgi:hypothetical protein